MKIDMLDRAYMVVRATCGHFDAVHLLNLCESNDCVPVAMQLGEMFDCAEGCKVSVWEITMDNDMMVRYRLAF